MTPEFIVKNYKLFFKFVLTELYLENLDAITIYYTQNQV